jgi:hypothetical protein
LGTYEAIVGLNRQCSLAHADVSAGYDRTTKRGYISVVRLLCQLRGACNIASSFLG